MNRLPLWAGPRGACPEPDAAQPNHRETAAGYSAAPVHSFCPIHYEPGYAYPLIVWLHAEGGHPAELRRVMPLISARNFVGVAVRGTRAISFRGVQHLWGWGDSPEQIRHAAAEVDRGIEYACQRYRVSLQRIFLVGHDAGGTMALRLALMSPYRFAGAVSLGGRFPEGHALLAAWQSAQRVPLMIAHGRDSQQYSTDQLCRDLRRMHVARLRAAIRQYPCGQEITTAMLSDVNQWIMEQLTGSVSQRPTTPSPSGNVLN